jgi:hypothetical protein
MGFGTATWCVFTNEICDPALRRFDSRVSRSDLSCGDTGPLARRSVRQRLVHDTTDQRRKTPNAAATADHARTKAGDRRHHHDKMDSKRETPANGSTRPAVTDRTASAWRTMGVRDVGATSHSATPNANRKMEATHRPVFDCQRAARAIIPAGKASPKRPMPRARIETTTTIRTATTYISAD